MKEILPLTSLRFLAAVLVVAEHVQMFRGFEVIGFALGHELGRTGVTVFFVLSGYILSYTYLDRNWLGAFRANTREFFIGRFARIFPLHWLMFLAALPLGLNSVTSRVSVTDFPWLLTLTDGFWPAFSTGPQPVKAAWTLSCEALFYFVTPGLFFVLAKTSRKALWSGLIVLGYTLTIFVSVTIAPMLNWFAYLRVPEFLLGVFGFIISREIDLSRKANLVAASGAALLLFAGLILPIWIPRAVPFATALGALLVILGCAQLKGRLGELLSKPGFVLLGHSSYALYLMHDPVLRYLKVFVERTGLHTLPVAVVLLVLLAVAGTIMASIVCYKRFETPARLLIRRRLSQKHTRRDAFATTETVA